MADASKSVASIKESLGTWKSYVQTIDGEYNTYVNSHNVHTCAKDGAHYIDGNRPSDGNSWLEYKNKVSEVIKFLELYVDDSAWVEKLGNRHDRWKTAQGHVEDAVGDVAESKLPALTSWRGPAGDSYRKVAPKMRSSAEHAGLGAQVMKKVCTEVADAGETFFSDLQAAASTLAKGLRHYTPAPAPWKEGDPDRISPSGSYSCGYLHENDSAGNEPWTAMTSCETAKTALQTAVNNNVDLPGPTASGSPRSVADAYAGNWPDAPG